MRRMTYIIIDIILVGMDSVAATMSFIEQEFLWGATFVILAVLMLFSAIQGVERAKQEAVLEELRSISNLRRAKK